MGTIQAGPICGIKLADRYLALSTVGGTAFYYDAPDYDKQNSELSADMPRQFLETLASPSTQTGWRRKFQHKLCAAPYIALDTYAAPVRLDDLASGR